LDNGAIGLAKLYWKMDSHLSALDASIRKTRNLERIRVHGSFSVGPRGKSNATSPTKRQRAQPANRIEPRIGNSAAKGTALQRELGLLVDLDPVDLFVGCGGELRLGGNSEFCFQNGVWARIDNGFR
jgi:hypothetical protein